MTYIASLDHKPLMIINALNLNDAIDTFRARYQSSDGPRVLQFQLHQVAKIYDVAAHVEGYDPGTARGALELAKKELGW